jgi:C-terminal processing protease CtpA/Prc
MRRLDPFSQYLDRTDYADLKTLTEGEFGGLGIVISIRDNYPTVISPVEGTPAYALGIQSGDVIVKIDGQSTRGLLLRGRGAQVARARRHAGHDHDRARRTRRRATCRSCARPST